MSSVKKYKNIYEIYELIEEETKSMAKVCPERGGIIIEFQSKGDKILYLDEETFFNPNTNIRGGNPILFPICGQLENGEYEIHGEKYKMKNHGLARIMAWNVEDFGVIDNVPTIKISLESNDETKKSYPFDFIVAFTYTIKKGVLNILQEYTNNSATQDSTNTGATQDLTNTGATQDPTNTGATQDLTNTGAAPELDNTGAVKMPFYAGFHPYFSVRSKKLTYNTSAKECFDYNDMKVKDFSREFDLEGLKEAVLIKDDGSHQIEFGTGYERNETDKRDGIEERNILLKYGPEFNYIMLWSVEGKQFVCVEPWMARTGEFQRKNELIWLSPGETLRTFLSMESK